ncbi:carbonic anhydrase [Gorgonomyces haynaldii]|nr:carbonic anhydrase [Gorgonomyces haynaldii]
MKALYLPSNLLQTLNHSLDRQKRLLEGFSIHSSPTSPIRMERSSSEQTRRIYLDKFLAGYKRFRTNYFADKNPLYHTLRDKQTPSTIIIGCCDSRVDPAIITDCEPGDLFIVRNVANLVAPFHPDGRPQGVSTALEYAVTVLNVENIIVLGHSSCGGIRALMEGVPPKSQFLGPWMAIAQTAKERTERHFGHRPFDEQCRACEYASILNSLENLISYPWIKERLMDGTLTITGWYFDFQSGHLLRYNPDAYKFEDVNLSHPDDHPRAAIEILGSSAQQLEQSTTEVP